MRLLVIGGGRGMYQIRDALSGFDGTMSEAIPMVGFMDDDIERFILLKEYWGKIDGIEAERRFNANDYDYAIISISTSNLVREKVFNEFQKLYIPFANIIHSTAYESPKAEIGTGNVILANCHIGTHAKIGDNNFISAGCNIEHHNEVGSHCTFGPSVITSSRCKIGNRVKFGTGIFMEPGVEVGDDCIIGSGTILTMNTKVPPKHIIKTRISSLPQEIK